jgi:hypothetical protein
VGDTDQVEMWAGLTSAQIGQSTRSENRVQFRVRSRQIVGRFPQAPSEILEGVAQGALLITKERMNGLPDGASDPGIAMYRVRNAKSRVSGWSARLPPLETGDAAGGAGLT